MHDIRFALRQLLKSPGFTVVAILTLALGIGACTAIFTVVNSVLLRPVAYPESERLMVIQETYPPEFPTFSVSPANFKDWTLQADLFESMYANRDGSFNLTGEGEPIRLTAARPTGRYFETLRVPPVLGRAFGPAEDVPGKNQVVVLSHAFWQAQFGGRPGVINEILRLNGQPYTIIGVMPEEFQRGYATQIYVPCAFTDKEWEGRGGHYISVVGRLKPGVTVAQARAQLETIAARLATQYPDTNKNWGVKVTPILEFNTGSLRPTLITLLGAVGFLLLIACANVANLLLARASGRLREISIRAALGASRARVVRQMLTESLLLALLGGTLGVLLGKWGLDGLLALAGDNLPRAAEVVLDRRAIVFTFGVTLLTGVGFGLVPALQSTKVNLVDALKEGARGTSGAGHRHWLRSGLVVAEIALALMLLTGAGMLMRSFAKLASASPGFNPHEALMVSLAIPREKYSTPEKQAAFAEAVIARFRPLPGVQRVGATHVLPFSGNDYVLGLEIQGKDVAPSDLPSTNYFAVTSGYFQAMGIPLIRGRYFTDQDRAGAPPVAIISQALARQFFPNQDPLGKRINMTNGPQVWREIVGVVGDVKHYGFDAPTAPQSYDPLAQSPFPFLSFVVRAPGPAMTSLTGLLRQEIHAVDPEQPVFRIESLDNLVADSMARQRFAMTLFGLFSGLALVLAAIGIYGVMAYAVAQRTSEFGIRMALGARPRDVLGLVLGHGVRLIGLGVLVGLAGSLAGARLIQSMLYQTSARDPLVFASIALLLGAVAFLACLIPARRATRVDPIVALRSE